MTDAAYFPRGSNRSRGWSSLATRAVLEALAAAGSRRALSAASCATRCSGFRQRVGGGRHRPRDPGAPERVIAVLEKRGIKAVPTGLAHGTVTAVPAITAGARRGISRSPPCAAMSRPYGRHARVAFDADWAADAARRDFTINAIFLSPDGTLYDPVGGLADLAARRVRFVGDPATRIAEDVLRILRYYRFEARFGAGQRR